MKSPKKIMKNKISKIDNSSQNTHEFSRNARIWDNKSNYFH